MPITVTTLMENRVAGNREDLAAEHGLSFLVETPERRILFDTGASGRFLDNGRKLGKFPGPVDGVFLSHGHYDHAGGLPHLLASCKEPLDLFAGPEALVPRGIHRDGGRREIGPPKLDRAMETGALRFHPLTAPGPVFPGGRASGPIPLTTEFEAPETGFTRGTGEEREPDAFPEERVLVLETGDGPVVLTGCAHRGIVNTLRHLAETLGIPHFHALLGGLHLMNADTDRIDRTVAELHALDVDRIGAGHCTGEPALRAIRQAFPGRWMDIGAGAEMTFPDPPAQSGE
jgi:7,8-dihydropterin-6-yl-methyl-4-(beta-D-ribofuranosyl)aminobenzene 5'-phosphate synthase